MLMSKQQPVYGINLTFSSLTGNLPLYTFDQIQESTQEFV